MNIKKMKFKKLSMLLCCLMAGSAFIAGSMFMPFAVENEELTSSEQAELDEADQMMTDELLKEEAGDDWDHVTWDDEHKEMVWVTMSASSWKTAIPSLKFNGNGMGSIRGETSAWLDENSYVKTTVDEVMAPYITEGSNKYKKHIAENQTAYQQYIIAVSHSIYRFRNEPGWNWLNTDKFPVSLFLEGGRSPSGSTDEEKWKDSIEQIATAVLDKSTSSTDIFTREGVEKELNSILQGKWVNKMTKDVFDVTYSGSKVNLDGSGQYEMNGWFKTNGKDAEGNFIPLKDGDGNIIGREDNLGSTKTTYTSPRPPSASASASASTQT